MFFFCEQNIGAKAAVVEHAGRSPGHSIVPKRWSTTTAQARDEVQHQTRRMLVHTPSVGWWFILAWRLGLRMNLLAHRLPGGVQAQGMKGQSMQDWSTRPGWRSLW